LERGLTPKQVDLLRVLAETGEMTLEELASRLGVSRSTVKRYVLSLEKRGLVARLGGMVRLTPEGRRAAGVEGGGGGVLPLVFSTPSGAVPLRVKSLRQLYAVIHYGLLEPEELEYMLRVGCISSWLRLVLGEEELASHVDGLRGLPGREAMRELEELLRRRLALG